jgi:hypothetical protein
MAMLSREQYHKKRLDKAIAEAMQCFYDCMGDEDTWEKWVFEAEERLLCKVRERICREDGFLLQ